MAEPWQRVAEHLEAASRVLCFTGAGVSTASNIPDFRGPEGVFRTRSPTYFSDFVASEDARVEYWSFKLEGFRAFRDARPSATHLALVELEQLGRVQAVVSQNVDGLHAAAGTSAERLIELHGSNAEAECLNCSAREAIGPALDRFAKTREPPRCGGCHGLLKPAVVMFGQSLDPETMRRALRAAERADLVLALGSSLTVTPAAEVPLAAARRRVPYVIVNRGATPHDELATLKLDADVEEVVPKAVRALGARASAAPA